MRRPIFMLIILLVLIPLGIQGGVLLARASGREPDRAQTAPPPS